MPDLAPKVVPEPDDFERIALHRLCTKAVDIVTTCLDISGDGDVAYRLYKQLAEAIDNWTPREVAEHLKRFS